MDKKITLPALSSMIALRTGLTKRLCEDFVRELFQLIGNTLADGESVKIQDLGTFRLSKVEPRMSVDVLTGEPIQIPGHRKVVFVPAKELADSINTPFEAFEPIELPEQFDEADLDHEIEVLNEEETEPIIVNEEAIEPINLNEEATEPVIVNEEEDLLYQLPAETEEEIQEEKAIEPEKPLIEDKEVPEPPIKQEPAEPKIQSIEEPTGPIIQLIEDPIVEEEKTEKKSRFGIGFIIGFLCCVIIFGVLGLVGYRSLLNKIESMQPVEIPPIEVEEELLIPELQDSLVYNSVEAGEGDAKQPAETTEERTVQITSENGIEADTQPSDKKVYDTISRTRYLTTMAKEHYGDFNLWPYIYEENKAFLGHPDRIKPGTKVVIPPLSKYGVNPKSKADIEKARRMGAEIYARY